MLCSLSKVLGITHQVTNKLLEWPGAEAQEIVMFSDLADQQRSDQARLVFFNQLVAEPQSVTADGIHLCVA